MPSQGVVPIVVIAAREFVADLGVIATVAAWRDIGFEPRPKFAAKGLASSLYLKSINALPVRFLLSEVYIAEVYHRRAPPTKIGRPQ